MAWYAKTTGLYGINSAEAIANVTEIVNSLQGKGFSLRSACAIAGNIADESGYNPWRWEGDNVQSVNSISSTVGYGLFQFTPPTNYINSTNYSQYINDGYAPNFSDQAGNPSDGNAQMEFMEDNYYSSYFNTQAGYNRYEPYFTAAGIDISQFYWITEDEMKSGVYTSTGNEITIANLTGAFMLCWERPNQVYAPSHYQPRVDAAVHWWDYFNDNPPTPPDPPVPPPIPPYPPRKMPLWMMLRHHW